MKCAKSECKHETGLNNGNNDLNYLCRCCSEPWSFRYYDKQDCIATISIPRAIAEELQSDLHNLMNAYHYNSQGSDYSCSFCYESPVNGVTHTIHKDDCLGKKLDKILSEQLR